MEASISAMSFTSLLHLVHWVINAVQDENDNSNITCHWAKKAVTNELKKYIILP